MAQLTLVLGLLGTVVWTAAVEPPARASHDPGAVYCAGPAEMEMLALINDFRAGRGLERLGLSEPLGAAATHKSEAMASEGFFSHVSPAGVTPRELVMEHGYLHNTATGENIAAGQESAEATFAQWRDSPSHRELLLDEEFTAIGIARAYNVETRYDWYWVVELGGVLADPAEPCEEAGDGPREASAATPRGGVPVRLLCEGTRLADGTYDLTCRDA